MIRLVNNKIIILIVLIMTTIILFFALSAQATINKQINYQGKLFNSNEQPVNDGDYNMEFRLCVTLDCTDGADPIWTETRTGGNKVTVKTGLFSVLLGEVSSIASVDFNQDLWLGVNIGGTGAVSWDGEMTPRKKLGAVNAAIVSASLKSDVDGNEIVANSANNLLEITQSGTGDIFRVNDSVGDTSPFLIDTDGNVGVGDATPDALLDVAGSFRLDGTFGDKDGDVGINGQILASTATGTDWIDSSTLVLGSIDTHSDVDTTTVAPTNGQVLTWNGTNWIPTDSDEHTGTTGSVFFANNSSGEPTEDNSNLFWDDTNNRLGVGTNSPSLDLDVDGSAYVQNVLRAGNWRHVLSKGLNSTATNGYLLTTTIPYDTTVNRGMHSVRIKGYAYGESDPIDFVVNFYLYTGSIHRHGWTNFGAYDPGIVRLSYEGSVLKIWWSNTVYYPNFEVFVNSHIGSVNTDAHFENWDITDDVSPATNVLDVAYRNAEPQGLTMGGNIVLNNSWLSGDGGNEGIFVTSAGQVGVGTNNPSQDLHISGNARLTGALYDNNNQPGTAGQILSSTATGTDWIDSDSLALGSIDAHSDVDTTTTAPSNGDLLVWDGANWVTTSATDYIDNIYTADGTLAGNRTVTGNGNNLTFTDTQMGINRVATNHAFEIYGDDYDNMLGLYTLPGDGAAGMQFFPEGSLGLSILSTGDGNDARIIVADDQDFAIDSNGVNNRLFIQGSDGNVGINTSSPSETLDINGDTRLRGALYDFNNQSGTAGQILSTTATGTDWIDSFAPVAGTSNNNTLRWNGTAWVESSALQNDDTDVTVSGDILAGSATSNLGSAAQGFDNIYSDLTQGSALFIGANGLLSEDNSNFFWDDGNNRLGIGTNSSNYTLDVAGEVGVDRHIYHNGDSNTYIDFTPDRIRIYAGGRSMIDMQQDNDDVVFNEGSTQTDFRFEGNTEENLLFLDGSADMIGIATNAPSQILDVVGNIELNDYLYFRNGSSEYLRHDNSTFVLSDDLLPSADDTLDLGATGSRWQDLYLGPQTLHIGSSLTDEGLIGYDTTNNILTIDTDATTAGDIAFNSDDLFIDTSNSRVGIGDTTPDADLDVAGSLRVDGEFYDKDGDAGAVGQVLSSTATGTDWIANSSNPIPFISTTDRYKMLPSTTSTFTLEGVNFTPTTAVSITNSAFTGTIDSVNVLSPTEMEVTVTSTATEDLHDIVLSNSGVLNTAWTGNGVDLFEVISNLWTDLRLGGDVLTDGNGAGNDIRYRSGMSMNRDANGMSFSGLNPWNSWVKFESLGWTRGTNQTLSWVFTGPDDAMMIGIGSDATNEGGNDQYRQAEVEIYFNNSTNMWGLYGNNGTVGSAGNQSHSQALGGCASDVFKGVFESDGDAGDTFTLYCLPSANPSDWDDTATVMTTFSIGGSLAPDETNIMPFIIPRSGGAQRFVAVKVE